MLTVSARQMSVLAGSNDAIVERRIRNAAVRFHGRAIVAMSDERLSDVLRTGIQRARAYGLRQLDSIMLFVLLMLEIAPGFDRQQDIFRYLTARDADRDAAMLSICETIDVLVWNDAARLDGPEEWVRVTRVEM